jgi:hypothetical protein
MNARKQKRDKPRWRDSELAFLREFHGILDGCTPPYHNRPELVDEEN